MILYFAYPTFLLLMIVDFVKCLRRKAKWRNLFIFEAIAVLVAALIYHWGVNRFTTPLNDDFILGFIEATFGWFAMRAYGIMLGITAITKLVIYVRTKKGTTIMSISLREIEVLKESAY